MTAEEIYLNSGLDIVGIMVCVTLVVCMILDHAGKTKSEKLEISVFSCVIFYFATDFICHAIRGNITIPAVVQICNILYFIACALMPLMFCLYTISCIPADYKQAKKLYYTKLVAMVITAIGILFIISNPFTGIYFTVENGLYTRSRYFYFSQSHYYFILVANIVIIIRNRKKLGKRSIGLLLYSFFPMLVLPLQFIFYGGAISSFIVILAALLDFIYIYSSQKVEEQSVQKKLAESNIRLMLSQIQPHFIYNSLSSISEMCTIDPQKAQELTDNFADYLRANFSALSTNTTVPFEKEMEHVRFYLSLEKARFGDRLNVEYDLKATSFSLPTLTMQTLVENAVHHGICKKEEGGTVTIRTYETETHYVVKIEDDGVGFDATTYEKNNGTHVGIRNVRARLAAFDSTLFLRSQRDQGTVVTIRVPKPLKEYAI